MIVRVTALKVVVSVKVSDRVINLVDIYLSLYFITCPLGLELEICGIFSRIQSIIEK